MIHKNFKTDFADRSRRWRKNCSSRLWDKAGDRQIRVAELLGISERMRRCKLKKYSLKSS
jgi:hypothetical protein